MSVLNKMLRDLEKRQHVSERAATPLSARSDERPLWLNLLLLLSALLNSRLSAVINPAC